MSRQNKQAKRYSLKHTFTSQRKAKGKVHHKEQQSPGIQQFNTNLRHNTGTRVKK